MKKGFKRCEFTLTKVFLPHMTSSRENAFTLAEVLITLGIIGVVAALTLPSLIKGQQRKEFEAGLKKGYSVLSQALISMNNEEGYIANKASLPGRQFVKIYKNYFNLIKDCGNQDCEPLGRDDEGAIDYHSKVYKTFSKGNIVNNLFDEGQFITSDGMFVMIDDDTGVRPIMISIDVNGYKKNPNLWGYDLFTFEIDEKTGKLVPMGQEGTFFNGTTTYCSKKSTHGFNGVACAYEAMTDPNYFKSLP